MTEPLTEEELQKIRNLCRHEGLDAFLPYVEQAAMEAKLRAARRLVWRSYRQMLITVMGLIVAVATFWEKTTAGAGVVARWLIGQ